MMNKCNDCEHFVGGGDWGLCCDLKYDLVYESTEACELFEQRGVSEMSNLDLLDDIVLEIKDRIYDLKDDIQRTNSRLEKQGCSIRIDELNQWVKRLSELRDDVIFTEKSGEQVGTVV